ncbi:MAG: HNH endonuclease [Myxococcota bacterium]|nr:HNH endonuclease [Deltaproteobacteria bacterium]MDQ3340923.1 HNH endonuclease [Myxococcota bacterium]
MLEVSVETEAMWRRTRNELDEASSERLSDDMFAQTLCRRATEEATTDAVPSRPVQTAVTTCRACKQSFVETGGESLPIDDATASRLTCDAEHIGDLESDEITRVKPTIPAAIRRKVFHRDHFACVVPGCRSKRHLDLHHVVPRQHGGDHSMSNVAVLCFGCHRRHHAGSLKITGRAPDLHFAWERDDDVDSAMSPRWDWTDSQSAETGPAGADARNARPAVTSAATRHYRV